MVNQDKEFSFLLILHPLTQAYKHNLSLPILCFIYKLE